MHELLVEKGGGNFGFRSDILAQYPSNEQRRGFNRHTLPSNLPSLDLPELSSFLEDVTETKKSITQVTGNMQWDNETAKRLIEILSEHCCQGCVEGSSSDPPR